ncbi:MAG: cupin domain-containing protein [Leptolyngbyaceae cyanobacterium CSU_1_3]|nr:cupin domain-containing protein [Leptolyngbyaceae cyanobacterium CSU_1_3]
MVQFADMRRSFHLQLLPIQIQPRQVLNVEIVQHSYGEQAIYQQNIMSLGTDVQMPEICDAQDVTIAVLEGNGNLIVNDELVALEPGIFVFIPANTCHTLQTQSQLIFLLSRCSPGLAIDESSWVINL